MGFGWALRVQDGRVLEEAVEEAEPPVRPEAAQVDGYGSREGFDSTSSEVTRLLCRALYTRPDRTTEVRQWWRKLRGEAQKPERPRRSTRRRIYLEGSDDCPHLGEPMARWVRDHVLHGPPLPVPSYGFDLMPVLAHSLRARRWRGVRRVLVLTPIAAVAYATPWAASLWLGACALACLIRWVTLRLARTGRPSRRLSSPRLAYVMLCVPWLVATVPFWLVRDERAFPRLALLVMPFVVMAGIALIHIGDRLMARAALSQMGRAGFTSGRLPWVSARARRRIAHIGDAQTREELPYDHPETFVGAGRDVWSVAEIGIRLTSKDPERAVALDGDRELLRRMGRALDELGNGEQEITEGLPGFSVTQVVGMPSELWLRRTRAAKVAPPDLSGRGMRSPSSVPDRPYLRAQSVSWCGQVVVNVFVHAALEAGELRLTLRPHVMTPLCNELRVTDAPVAKRGLRLAGWVVLQALLDAANGPVSLWRQLARSASGAPAAKRTAEEDPLSLRDRYSTEEITDMHQADDAKRHVVLMQACIFRTVSEYLEERGVDTAPYERQVAAVITNIQVYGDNNAPIQNVAGSGISQVGQGADAQ